jgi:hypothetical protein
MIISTILVNLFSESIKQTIFYIFNILNKSVQPQDKPKEDPTESDYDDPQLDDMSEPDVTLRQYSLRERKTINYKV